MESPINCPIDDALLTDYLSQELPEADRQAIEKHLSECPACREQLDQIRNVTALVVSAGSIEPPEGFAERIVSRAKLRDVEPPELDGHAPADGPRRRSRKPRFGLTVPEPRFALGRPMRIGRVAVYAAGAAVLILLYVANDLRQTGDTQPGKYSLPDYPHIALQQATTEPGGPDPLGDLLDYPFKEWDAARYLPDDTVGEHKPGISVDAFDWPARYADADIPQIMEMDFPTERLPKAPLQRIDPRHRPGVYLARTSTWYKKFYVRNIGGGYEAQEAVRKGLFWLRRHQDSDGKWDAAKWPGTGDSEIDSVGLTSLAVLAFLGDGHTPDGQGPFQTVCSRGVRWLLTQQNDDGSIGTTGRGANHALAAAALAEAHGMIRARDGQDRRYKAAAQKAMDYVLNSGDRFRPQGNDLGMAFEMTALRSGELAGLDVPGSAALEIRTAMANVPQDSALASPGQRKPNAVTPLMLSNMYLAGKTDANVKDADLQDVVQHLVNYHPQWLDGDTFYWFCGTNVMRQWLNRAIEKHRGGQEHSAQAMVKAWKGWNEALRKALLDHQTMSGRDRGSWEPKGSICLRGGRAMATALSVLTLESYYRYLPAK